MEDFLNRIASDSAGPIGEILMLAAEASDVGWWDVEDGHGRLNWPPRTKAMFGISPDEPVSMADFYAGLHPDDYDRVAAFYAKAADPAERAVYDVEYRTIGKEDGVLRWVAAKGRGIFDETGRCKRVIGTAVDITERRRAQEQAQVYERERAELRERFIAMLGHDLRNPLASIAAGTKLLARHPEKAPQIIEQIDLTVARMAALVDNILDLARGRLGGGLALNRDSSQPLEPYLRHVIDELRMAHPQQRVNVDIALRDPANCDRRRVGQLVSNLLGNAFVYGDPGEPIEVRVRCDHGQFELSVTNSGPSIDPEVREKLFQPFFRASAQRSQEGLGLGLYICSEIVKAHGGSIGVTSEDGRTCFTARMPSDA